MSFFYLCPTAKDGTTLFPHSPADTRNQSRRKRAKAKVPALIIMHDTIINHHSLKQRASCRMQTPEVGSKGGNSVTSVTSDLCHLLLQKKTKTKVSTFINVVRFASIVSWAVLFSCRYISAVLQPEGDIVSRSARSSLETVQRVGVEQPIQKVLCRRNWSREETPDKYHTHADAAFSYR